MVKVSPLRCPFHGRYSCTLVGTSGNSCYVKAALGVLDPLTAKVIPIVVFNVLLRIESRRGLHCISGGI